MAFEIDHLFVFTSAGGSEADRLVEVGLTEGSPSYHAGQGTRNRRFFFHGSMLELLWVSDREEACGEETRRTTLWDRWRDRGRLHSPYGICLRRTSGKREPPFAAWRYKPDFLPSRISIDIAEDVPLTEPLWFFMRDERAFEQLDVSGQEPVDHRLGMRAVTGVHVLVPQLQELSEAALAIVRTGLVTMETGDEHLLELTFDYGSCGREHDFRPDLPLAIRW